MSNNCIDLVTYQIYFANKILNKISDGFKVTAREIELLNEYKQDVIKKGYGNRLVGKRCISLKMD